jgi:tetratricopeptide (TPR) repeat protein
MSSSKSVDLGLKLPKLSLKELAVSTAGYLIMAGVVNPKTGRAYGLNKNDEVDIMGPSIEEGTELGMQALRAVALNKDSLINSRGMVHRVTKSQVDLERYSDRTLQNLACRAQQLANEWGVDETIRRLSLKDGPLKPFKLNPLKPTKGRTLQEKVDDFIKRYKNGAKDLNKKDLQNMLDELHGLIGSGYIPYKKGYSSLLALQRSGRAQCVVFSVLGNIILKRVGLKPKYVCSMDHVYLKVKSCYYDGSDESNPTKKSTNPLIEVLPSIGEEHSAGDSYRSALSHAGRFKEAGYCSFQYLRLSPKSAIAHSRYAIELINMKRLEEAKPFYFRALKINPNNPRTCYNYGWLAGELKMFKEAEKYYRRVIKIKADHVGALGNLAEILVARNKLKDALVNCLRALEIDPNHTYTYCYKANALYLKGEIKEAKAAFKKAKETFNNLNRENAKDFEESHAELANILKKPGTIKQADFLRFLSKSLAEVNKMRRGVNKELPTSKKLPLVDTGEVKLELAKTSKSDKES